MTALRSTSGAAASEKSKTAVRIMTCPAIFGIKNSSRLTRRLKIQPQDVENVAAAFEHVRDACVFAAPDELLGKTVAIALAMNGAEPGKLAALHDWMQARLSRHKMPSKWYILETLPRTSRGKIHRPTIAELCAARQSDDPRDAQ